MAEDHDDPFAGSRMSLGEHLDELRRRLLRGAVVVTLLFLAAWGFREHTTDIVMRPFERTIAMLNADLVERAEERLAADAELARADLFDEEGRLLERIDRRPIATGVAEGFFFSLRMALYLSLFLGGPYLLWELWQFVAVGLYRHEQRLVTTYFPFSALLFVVGVLFGYYAMVPFGMYYLATTLSIEQVRPEFKLDQYFALLTSLTLALGIVFQLPVVMLVLTRLELIEPRQIARYRGHFLVVALIVAAILTPPDPFTQMLMAVPMAILFEIGLVVARVFGRPADRATPATPAAAEGAEGAPPR